MTVVRLIEEKDNARMGEIIQKSLEDANLAIVGSAYYDPQIHTLSAYYAKRPKENYWVVEVNGRVAGGVGIGQFEERQGLCELQKLYVDSAYRKQGLSHLLMDIALDYARKHYATCYLETFASLDVAIKLYEKYGFNHLDEPYPETEHGACDVWMEKIL